MGLQRLRSLFGGREHLRPQFIIIGVQKAGTSALFKMLAEHEQVLAPAVKELHFFDRDAEYARGLDHYWRQFPLDPADGRTHITFEATPSYIFHPQVPERMLKALPQVRCIAVLRDPVSRAYSAWNMRSQFKEHPSYAASYDPRTFEQAVNDELSGDTRYAHLNDYLARGDYATQLERYFRVMPRERMLVITHERLTADRSTVLRQVTDHLGLPPLPTGTKAQERRFNKRPYEAPLDPALAERLRAHFAPHMQRLDQLLGSPVEFSASF